MIRSFKNIFAITALTLIVAPALRCEETHAPSKGKLQSAIDYVKNIRTPLTSQEKLAQFIAQADVTGFKNASDALVKEMAPEERAQALQGLTSTAQEVKQALQTELKVTGNKVKKSTLFKGAAQTISGLLLASTAAISCAIAYKSSFFKNYDKKKLNKIEKIALSPYRIILDFLVEYCNTCASNKCKKHPKKYFSTETNGKINCCSGAISLLTGAILGAYTTKSGVLNCKNGWNYKAYLEQQIKNIDEITEFIQVQQKLN